MSLITGDKIKKAHPYGFKSFLIVGDRGIGKSSYGLRVCREVYDYLGFTGNKGWDKALDCCKFHIRDVIDFLRDATELDEPAPVMLWDDIGIHAQGSIYFLNMKLVAQLKGVLDTIRTAITGLIMTAPTSEGLLSILKHYDDYKLIVRYSTKGGYNREVAAYKWRTLPSGKRIIQTKYYDEYSCYLPTWVFNRYMKMRKQALIDTLASLDETIEK